MIYISILIAVIYFVLISTFIIGFEKITLFKNKNLEPKNKFSIIIPFRNEAHNLKNLLTSLYNLNYPTNYFEVLLIDDNSSDNYLDIVHRFTRKNRLLSIRVLQKTEIINTPKKDAINLGIKNASFDWVVTTDADCIVPNNWLYIFNQQIEESNSLFISAPVKFIKQKGLLYHFQNLNFISLIGSTIGSFGIAKPFLCNGANLCYNKAAFYQVKGYWGNSKIASGDDVFLLEKMKTAFPKKISYIKSEEAIVQTNSENTLNCFLNQQIRWASKSTAYKSLFSKFVGTIVLSINLVLITLLITTIINPFFWKLLILIFIQKLFLDFLLIYKTATFLKSTQSLKHYMISSILHPFFIIFIGILSLFKNYEWKGRVFKK
ncbi:MAG: glycosyltransferase [Lutibacter sp.]|uniref:glycosyltransferase n=1 Tax=Lutibacter sp. TaxID=1925666 RepID=UPI00385F34CD